ncbi:hypothetical protein NQ176_g3139 [Zarea fungicola]|uniref:Uncharacterized protein n=1 Tax=Zarea fungicola TaxID=93591 RepID=A0ACC1NJW8_9HYPO|nr:hypothetical protein NQ176_g3139 [Lecanicillium fungicola]
MPKPNTRFLRNIIKGTTNHNRALLEKEAAESKARLTRLERNEEIKRKRTNPTTKDIRNRHMGDIQEILRGGRRKRRDLDKGDTAAKHTETSDRNDGRRKSRRSQVEDSEEGVMLREISSAKEGYDEARKDRCSRRDSSYAQHSRHTSHSSKNETSSHRDTSSHDERSRSPRSRHRSERRRSRDAERRRRQYRAKAHGSPSPLLVNSNADGESKSLQDDFIGPAPIPVIRGRGAAGALSGIDRRFSASYDPKMDIQADDDNP